MQIKELRRENVVLQASADDRIKQSDSTIVVLKDHIGNLNVTLQAATDALTNSSDISSNKVYTGNYYKTYVGQVSALHNKYDLAADWGCMTLKNIVDVRAAFMIGRGIRVVKRASFKGDATRELEWLRGFVKYNNIDEESPQDWAIGTELEGKVLLRLRAVPNTDKKEDRIRVLYVPWQKQQYTVAADIPDYYTYTDAFYTGTQEFTTAPGKTKSVNTSFALTAEEFVYRRFGGSAYEINDTPPKSAFVIRHIEDLDKELWDWRKINNLFAAPTPVFEMETTDGAKKVQGRIDSKNWTIGKGIAIAGGKLVLVQADSGGSESIQKAAEADVQAISGATGVPVHFLGHPELLSNRATAENLLELIELSTGKERKIWVGAYEELFQKAILMHNEEFHGNLNPEAVTAEIPFTSSQNLNTIEEVYLPMYVEGAMSLQQLLSYVAELDVEVEVERIKENKTNDLAANKQLAGNGGLGNSPDGGRQLAGPSKGGR